MIKIQNKEWRREEGREFFPPFFLFHIAKGLIIKSNIGHSSTLNFTPKTLILLTINLTKAVDKAVDKLWISCGGSCG
jgi:hypothetical protein